jgi:hypothetical protein
MILRNSNPKGTVLFLHGFPETLYAWKDIAKALKIDPASFIGSSDKRAAN